MRHPRSWLFPLHAALFALVCLGVPQRAVAQGCVECFENDEGKRTCVPKPKGAGYESCTIEKGEKNCKMSSGEPDCGLVLALDGRSLAPYASAIGVGEIPEDVLAPVRSPGRAAEAPFAAAQRACAGAIIQRRYAPERIVELRSGLRRVEI